MGDPVTEIEDRTAHDLIVRATDVGVCPIQLIPRVLYEWREPRHEAFAPRNAWSLFNAFTEALKGNLIELPRRTEALHGLLEVLGGIGELYAIEKQAREEQLTHDRRQHLRHKKSLPRLAALKQKVIALRQGALPKGAHCPRVRLRAWDLGPAGSLSRRRPDPDRQQRGRAFDPARGARTQELAALWKQGSRPANRGHPLGHGNLPALRSARARIPARCPAPACQRQSNRRDEPDPAGVGGVSHPGGSASPSTLTSHPPVGGCPGKNSNRAPAPPICLGACLCCVCSCCFTRQAAHLH